MAVSLMQIPCAAGLDESQEGESLDPRSGFSVLENVRQERTGGYSKRLGFAALTAARLDGTSRSAGNRVLMHGDVPCVIDGTVLDDYSAAVGRSISRGRVPEAAVSTRPTASYAADASYTTLLDCCVAGNVIAYAHSTSEAASFGAGSLVLTVEDVVSGAVLRAPELMFTADASGPGNVVCAMASYSTFIFAIYLDDQTAGIYVRYLDTSSPSTISAGWIAIGTTFVTDNVIAGQGADALSAQSLTDRVAFAYVNNSGGASRVTVWTLNTGGAIDGTTVSTSSVTPNLVTVEGSIADTLWIAWDETTSVKLKGIDATVLATVHATTATMLTLSSGTPTAIGIVSSGTAGHGRIIAGDGAHDRTQMRGFKITTGAAATDGSQITVPNAFVSGRPFRVGTRYYALFAPSPANVNNAQQACVLCDFTEDHTWLRPVANLAPNLATMALRARVESLGSSRYVTPIMVATSGAARSTVLVTFDFADRGRWQNVTHNETACLTGGLLSYFDGVRVAELGFVVRPPKPTTTSASTGITGTFRYVLVYEEVDASGNWCVSSISDPSAPATVSNKTITVTVRPLSITARQRRTGGGEVRLVLYRTDATGEGFYYRLTSLPNDTGNVVTTYADATVDVTSNAQLYSPTLPGSGSAQDRRAPPFCQAIASMNGMLLVASGSDLWWSGQTVSGEGTWFNPAFAVPIDGHGDIKAIAALDGTLYVFKRRSIFAITGEAPSDNGALGGLGTPRKLAADVGCIDPDSVLVTGAGIFFRSDRGLEILSRGGAVTWAGANVLNTMTAFPIVTSAVLDDINGLVRISVAEAESGGRASGDGRTIVYDLSLGLWVSTDKLHGSAASEATQSACMAYVAGAWRYTWLGADGVVHYERSTDDASAHIDGATWATQALESAWIKFAGLNGEQFLEQLLLLARRHTAHDLSISLAFDYVESFGTPRVFTAAEIALLARQWLVTEITQTTSTAVKVRIEDATPSSGTVGTGKGATWIAMTIAGRAQPGPKRSSSAQRGAAP